MMRSAPLRRLLLALLAAAAVATVGASAGAVELRGRVDGMNQNGIFPLGNANVEMYFGGQLIARALTGFDGFYYFSNIQPGMHELVVNGRIRVPILIQPQPYQDIPPVLVR
jgi:hypothetical protein